MWNNISTYCHLQFCYFYFSWGGTQMFFDKMKRNYLLRLFSIVLAVHTIQDGLIVNAATASHKGMTQCVLILAIFPIVIWIVQIIYKHTRQAIRLCTDHRKNIQQNLYWIIRMCTFLHELLNKSPHFTTFYSMEIVWELGGWKRTGLRARKFVSKKKKTKI